MMYKQRVLSGLRKARNGLGTAICWGREQHQYVLTERREGATLSDGYVDRKLVYQCVTCKDVRTFSYSQMGPGDVELLSHPGSGVLHLTTGKTSFMVSLP